MIQKVILLLLLSLVAVYGQAPAPSTITVSPSGSGTVTVTQSGTISISFSNTVSITISGTVSITTSNTVSITTSITTSWSTSTSVSISLSNSNSATTTPSPTPSVTATISPTNSVNFYCGDGVITTSLNEECDFGSTNLLGNECCNANCKWKHIGARCTNVARSVCVAKGRCYKNPDKTITTGNFARLCVTTRNQPNGAGCPVNVNGTVVKGFCLNGICQSGRRFR